MIPKFQKDQTKRPVTYVDCFIENIGDGKFSILFSDGNILGLTPEEVQTFKDNKDGYPFDYSNMETVYAVDMKYYQRAIENKLGNPEKINRPMPSHYIPCEVENHYTALLVTFEDGKSLLIQDEASQQSFLESAYPQNSENDPYSIEGCDSDYYDMAE